MESLRYKGLEVGIAGLLFGLWLIGRPYKGIWHDSRLYTLQALNRLYPEIFGVDIFFLGTSQNDFTVFPFFHAQAIRFLGLDQAAYALTLLGKLSWFAALVFLARGLIRAPERWLGLALVVSVDPAYDGHKIFSYGESFLSGRLYAEIFGLLALGCWLQKRHRTAWILVIAALSIHPLMTLPVIALLLFQSLSTTRLVIYVAIGIAAAGVAMLYLSKPDADFMMLKTYDSDWFSTVSIRNNYVFLSNWEYGSFSGMALSTAIWSVVLVFSAENRDRHLALCILISTGLALLFSWLGSSFFHHIFLTQIQLYRFLWLFQLLGLLMLAKVVPFVWKSNASDRLCLVFLGCALLLDGVPQLSLIALGLLMWGCLRKYKPDWSPMRGQLLVIGLLPILCLGIKLIELDYLIRTNYLIGDASMWATLVADPLVVVVILAVVASALVRTVKELQLVQFIVGVLSVVIGVFMWDKSPAQSQFESPAIQAIIAPVQHYIPPGATVYWEGGLDFAWFSLKRAHYASSLQGAGVVFSKETSRVLSARQHRLMMAKLWDYKTAWGNNTLTAETRPTFSDLRYLCDDPDLDFAIINVPLSPRVDFEFGSRSHAIHGYIYNCSNLRNAPESYLSCNLL